MTGDNERGADEDCACERRFFVSGDLIEGIHEFGLGVGDKPEVIEYFGEDGKGREEEAITDWDVGIHGVIFFFILPSGFAARDEVDRLGKTEHESKAGGNASAGSAPRSFASAIGSLDTKPLGDFSE